MKEIVLAARTARLQPSPTLAMTAKARKLKSEGVDVIAFSAGEPDFNTPEAICDAAVDAMRAGATKYTPSTGTPELKNAVVAKLKRENGIDARPEEITVTCGAKHALYNAMMALLDPGDEVILIAPYWATYADQVRLTGAEPVVVNTLLEDGFVPRSEDLKAAISPKTRMIVVNSPSNPCGAMLPRQTLKEIAALALRHDLWILSDEIYERLIYGQEHQSVAALGKDVAERTITITGCSKTYAMTGWRIGFAHAPVPVTKAMANIQDQVTSNPVSFAQAGAIAALNMPDEEVNRMRDEFRGRRDLIVGLLRQVPGVEVREPEGAFYVFPNIEKLLGAGVSNDVEFADRLLTEAHIAVVPGSAFDAPGHLRFSYAASRSDIERGVARFAEFVAKL